MSSNKRNLYDSIFTHLFSIKRYALEAYQALSDDMEVTEDDITDITTNNVFVDRPYNDFSMNVKQQTLFFLEAQSTWSNNILYRVGYYYFEYFHDEMNKKKRNIYSSKVVDFPFPRFFVVYTGDQKVPNEIHFKDLHSNKPGYENCDLDITCHVIKGNPIKQDIFYQYDYLCDSIKRNINQYGNVIQSVEKAMDECIKYHILEEYIQDHRGEIMGIWDLLYNQEKVTENYVLEQKELSKEEGRNEGIIAGRIEGRNEGIIEGRIEGRNEGIIAGRIEGRIEGVKKVAINLKKKGMSISDIIACTGLSIEEIEKLSIEE